MYTPFSRPACGARQAAWKLDRYTNDEQRSHCIEDSVCVEHYLTRPTGGAAKVNCFETLSP